MKTVILAGGLGTRLSEETDLRPKPMVEIGGRPILWHIMKSYSRFGFNDFVICLGYKGYIIKEYFANYFLHQSDVTVDLSTNTLSVHSSSVEPWRVTLVDTGVNTMTGGRIKRVQKYIGDETFMLTYGDGVADVDIPALINHHRAHGRAATVTAVQPGGRFGALELGAESSVSSFIEKPHGDNAWINGGFFVLEPEIFKYISSDEILWEKEPLSKLSAEGKLTAYMHKGFWQAMDTLREKNYLNDLCTQGKTPWLDEAAK